jgi:ectoine hydroxylase-related dioxygenase (phytanoyl-CoA dioxygenase family)
MAKGGNWREAPAEGAPAGPMPYELVLAESAGLPVSDEEARQYRNFYEPDASAVEGLAALPAAVRGLLDEPFEVSDAQVAEYQERGFLLVKNVLPPALLAVLGAAIRKHTLERNSMAGWEMKERPTYQQAFIQVGGMWRHSGAAQLFSFSRRLASIATRLMQTEGTLLHHDQALFKEAGGGHTPWHCDQQYWPLDGDSEREAVSAWIPLQDVPLEMGPMMFAAGSARRRTPEDRHYGLKINDESERDISGYVKEQGLEVSVEPYALGDVSFHSGWCLHRADANHTAVSRDAHTMQYVGSDMRWSERIGKGGALGGGHAMDFNGRPGALLRESGVPVVHMRGDKSRL